ncbi:MAG: DUF3108 domain-containing protein [Marinilabiliales bacterium]|nr:MAG: DUF3108 domain-containing protein [Marinilabiliales bacterium]
MQKFLIFIFLILSSSALKSQENCEIQNKAFQIGEELDYVITYNWLLVWTDVGGVKFKVNKDQMFGQEVLNLKATGITYTFYDWFFQVRDVYQSWVNPGNLLPVYFHRDVDEGGYLIDIKYTFDYDNMLAYSEIEKTRKPYYRDTVAFPPCTYDVVSVIYQARNIDFTKYQIDEKIPFQILLDNEIHNVYMRYKGKEIRKVRGVGKFRCLKFTGSLVAGDVFQGGEDLVFWVTDDENRIPVWAESPIIVGTVKARLVNFSGLKYPLESLIKRY